MCTHALFHVSASLSSELDLDHHFPYSTCLGCCRMPKVLQRGQNKSERRNWFRPPFSGSTRVRKYICKKYTFELGYTHVHVCTSKQTRTVQVQKFPRCSASWRRLIVMIMSRPVRGPVGDQLPQDIMIYRFIPALIKLTKAEYNLTLRSE